MQTGTSNTGNIIQLLSDHLANQIAAGEVIQRPASAVKELLENAIDAGATQVQLVLKDAGKELIQVIDNGKGMNPVDARMSFERHATSKIRSIEDLFSIRTMGFRGEALASIAAVAQVELKTRQSDHPVGTRLCIEGTEVKLQEPCATPEGTSIAVKNLFYNVPARRHFLKSNLTEYRHIIDEFTRVALAFPQAGFRLWNNGAEQYHLEPGSLKTRIVELLGNNAEKNLVPVAEDTDLIRIKGFIGKPEAATRTRGMQFFFINDRYIRSPFLHHAVTTAYEGMIEKDSYPFYVLFLEIDPARVDVNVHPTKQEVKFEDDRLMYSYLQAAVKHSLARHNIAPSLDFTLNPQITQLASVNVPATEQQREETEKSYLYQNFTQRNQAHFIDKNDGLRQWKSLYQIAAELPEPHAAAPVEAASLHGEDSAHGLQQNRILQQGHLLIAAVQSGLMILDMRHARERIYYERLAEKLAKHEAISQQMLFPGHYECSPQDAPLLEEILPNLGALGFQLESLGRQSFAINGIPPELTAGQENKVLDELLEQLRNEQRNGAGGYREAIIRRLAKSMSRLEGIQHLGEEQARALSEELFSCIQPQYTPGGKKTFTIIDGTALEALLA